MHKNWREIITWQHFICQIVFTSIHHFLVNLIKMTTHRNIYDSKSAVSKANSFKDHMESIAACKTYNKNGLTVQMSCNKVRNLDRDTISWILSLTERNMKSYYEGCSWGWNGKKKKKEMTEDAAWYLIVKDAEGKCLGFSHFRFDMDYGEAVLYCYELQLEEEVRGKGLGSFMLLALELLALRNQMTKVILTLLLDNAGAIAFYKKRGYIPDKTSPDSSEKAPYQIWSKIFNKVWKN